VQKAGDVRRETESDFELHEAVERKIIFARSAQAA
jgi:hypothetical protein